MLFYQNFCGSLHNVCRQSSHISKFFIQNNNQNLSEVIFALVIFTNVLSFACVCSAGKELVVASVGSIRSELAKSTSQAGASRSLQDVVYSCGLYTQLGALMQRAGPAPGHLGLLSGVLS